MNEGMSDLVENRRLKHRMANILKRETSQPSFMEWNQPQGNKVEESNEEFSQPSDHGCLKASIWNKPSDDPRYILRMGTAKIRSKSEDMKIKTLDDKEREREQFAQYLREVEKRFKKSKIKGYSFFKKQKLSQLSKAQTRITSSRREKSRKIKSRNQATEKFIKLTDIFQQVKTYKNHKNQKSLSGIMSTSMNSSKNLEVSFSKSNRESNSK